MKCIENAEGQNKILEQIIETSINEIYFIDKKTLKFLYLNKQARKNLGYSTTDLRKMTPEDIGVNYNNNILRQLYGPLLAGKETCFEIEEKHKKKDGTFYNINLRIQFLKSGKEAFLVAIGKDISKQNSAEEKLRHCQKMESLGNLTSGIAHDFNNLLTAIMGSLQLLTLMDNRQDEEALECIEIAIQASKRAANLTHRLLAFSRKQPLNPEVIELNSLLKDFIPLLKRTLNENIEIRTHLINEDMFIEVDSNQLENCLLNLAVNASDAMPEGGSLTFEVEPVKISNVTAQGEKIAPGDYALISITDTGSGMTEDVRKNIFDPFFTTKDVGKGTGLGLSMVFGFAKQSGGDIQVYSELGKGTTFKLFLKSAERNMQEQQRRKTAKSELSKDKGVILLVEDEKEVMQFVTRALKIKGYNVLEVGDGPSALMVMKKTAHIDLLFADVVLPKGLNGQEIAKVFRKKYPKAGILFSSGHAGKAAEGNGLLEKGEDLLSKPYDLDELFRLVKMKIKQSKSP